MTYRLERQPMTWGQYLTRKAAQLCVFALAIRGALAWAGIG